ncbi:hypothetical protein M422DRAFT_785022 [Sphaerobolus stellatus SS14]|uniref:Uncharacterized protein n=1 Tax=Sphaerobolus stellatus (strain SS14) TaxID=990650 RepID=A0A0C9UNL1_SPHS4|nr:hypothetical protein M422DRAFT_785022 [Sphaerobolus stellatus SS14]
MRFSLSTVTFIAVTILSISGLTTAAPVDIDARAPQDTDGCGGPSGRSCN